MIGDERGNATVLALALMVPIALMLALAVKAGACWAVEETCAHKVGLAVESVTQPSFCLVLRSERSLAEAPELAVAKRIAEALRADGFTGRADIWVCNVDAKSIPEKTRALAYHASVEAGDVAEIRVVAGAHGNLVLYAAWGLDVARGAGKVYHYWVPAQSGTPCLLGVAHGAQDAPEGLAREIAAAKAKAQGY